MSIRSTLSPSLLRYSRAHPIVAIVNLNPGTYRLVVLLTTCALFTGCANLERTGFVARFLARTPETTACLVQFRTLDARVQADRARHSAAWPVVGFPFLRSDRFLASLRDTTLNAAAQSAWIAALAALDAAARRVELANLAATEDALPASSALDHCRTALVAEVLADPAAVARVRAQTQVPDEYRAWQRALGLYPLARIFARRGVMRLQRAYPVAESRPTGASGAHYRYGAARSAISAMPDWTRLVRDPLDRPQLNEAQQAALFAWHAPAWQVTQQTRADVIGAPRWQAGEVIIDTEKPTVYTYVSHTRFEARVLLQLNYVIWFEGRPPSGAFDLLAGKLDGLTWRVTLDTDGAPLLYDVMHNCGCYHQWFPSPRLARRVVGAQEEPLWSPFTIALGALDQTPLIHLAAGSHYLRAVTFDDADPAAIALAVRAYDSLYNLPRDPASRRSIFADDGVIHLSARGERFVMWPLGVPAPGAMRGRGHHATAFIGRRHFDDPDLIGKYFTRVAHKAIPLGETAQSPGA